VGHSADLGMKMGPSAEFGMKMGHSADFGSAPLAVAQNLIMPSGPERKICLCAMDHRSESLITVQNHRKFIQKFAAPLKE
jgi:hypothetical protein